MPPIPAFILPMLASALAAAQPAAKVEIAPGETLTLHVAGDGTASVDGRTGAPPLSDLEKESMGRAQTVAIVPGAKSQPAFTVRAATTPPPVAPGLLRITFRRVPPPLANGADGDMLLSIENGYDGTLRYKAAIRRGNGSKPTDVCVVMPLKRGFEQWPYVFDAIELSDFRLVPWHEGDSISCE